MTLACGFALSYPSLAASDCNGRFALLRETAAAWSIKFAYGKV
jgi:hypothetical protein